VDIEVQGADLQDATKLIADHPGITATHVKDRIFRVTIAADVPAGTYDLRVVSKYGVSSPRLFAVSKGLTEVLKKGQIAEMALAMAVPMNCAVNGSSEQGKDDFYRFPAKKGQRIVLDCFAQRLDSQLDASLVITDGEGRQLASNADAIGKDPIAEFIAPVDADYFVTVNDLSNRGGLPYRLVISDQQHTENLFPRALQAGKPSVVTVYGRNLGKDAKPSKWLVNDLLLDEMPETVDPPADIFRRGLFRFTDHPTAHSVLPTAATATLVGVQHRGVPLLVCNTPVTLEVEPNDDPKTPQKLTLPAVVSARFDKERDADWYEFEASETGSYSIEVFCERIAGRADPYLVVMDDKDNRVIEFDDFGARVNAFDGHVRDPSGSTNLTAKKTYRVLVQDRYRRGGARYQYVLTIRKAVPDFHIAAIHQQNPGPGSTSIRRGGATSLDLVVHNFGGFTGPITITAENLPKGLHAVPTTITSDTRGTFVLWADKDAPDFVGPVKLVATANAITRDVRPYTRVWANGDATSRPTRELIIFIGETSPYALTPAVETLTIEAGKKMDVVVKCERLWPDLRGPVTLTSALFPGSIKMSPLTIAEGKTEATATLDISGNTKPGTYTVSFMGQGQVPFIADPAKPTKANTLVQIPSRPLIIHVTEAKK